MVVTTAKRGDIPELVTLLSFLFDQETEFSPNAHVQERGLFQIIERPDVGHILVAREFGKIVGMVNILYTISTALGGRVCILEDMVVLPEARGRNAGTALLKSAIDHARKQGCLRITLLTDRTNILAQRLYGQLGFEASTMIPLRLSLGDGI